MCEYCNEKPVKVVVDLKNNSVYHKNRCDSNQCLQKLKSDNSLEKFGVDHWLKSKEIKQKREQTCLEKYGVNHISKTNEFKETFKQTCLDRYGVDNPAKSEVVKQHSKDTCLEKYGTDHWLKSDIGKEIYKSKLLERYGIENSFQTESAKNKNKLHVVEKIVKKLHDRNYSFIKIDENNVYFVCGKCKKEMSLDRHNFNIRYGRGIDICLNCKPFIDYSSQPERDVNQFINELGFETLQNKRNLLNGKKEIDIFVPQENLGIEYNGLYWHSFFDKEYHQNKKIQANENGINLIHIWEDDWHYKKNIVESKIKNILGKTENRIFARKCVIKMLDFETTKDFLNENHLQGNINSKIRIGLYFENTLVSVMTLGKRNNQFELLRFCNILNTNVIGGFSKLFKHFVNNNKDVKEIISYGDLDWLDLKNNVYNKNNFKFVGLTQPGYFWIVDGIRKNRQNFQKHKLIEQGFDKNKTEDEIMFERGYTKIYNSGNAKFIYEIEKSF